MFDEPNVGGGFGAMFTIVPIIIAIGFIIVIVSIIFRGARYVKNASSQQESIFARVVAKRTEVSGSSNLHNVGDAAMHHTHSSRTDYYITLEFEDGSRREFLDVKKLYGLLVEGDAGYAAIQGDWIVAFERQ
ncbi:DUF2500 domain-containing protein [Cohnella endophytica]|uniref:DUF2500 domain-containing protein n=1 Tax=Cohnella endophytica TaxID=2419778 RepID=A0A494Y700_9BACL|nr:DUF2500 domain-containing protein [Cohnella endophytica]RKP57305.1 DUF2500 domain-containing protein [Cohnella endophytica]